MNAQSNVIAFEDPARALRRARGAFVKSLIDAEDRSVRYVAQKAGINPTSMGERLKGQSPFLADELEAIAEVVRMDPDEFYKRYRTVGSEGFEPPTDSVKSREFAGVVLPFARKAI
jgi:hypothetical protein